MNVDNMDPKTMELLRQQQLEQYTWAYPSVNLNDQPVFLPKYVIQVDTKGRSAKDVRREQLYKFMNPQQRR